MAERSAVVGRYATIDVLRALPLLGTVYLRARGAAL